jgi:hypothetical protein
MILNETYDDILERLNMYSLNEGYIEDASKTLLGVYGKIRSEIKKQLPNCKNCIVSNDSQYTNVFVVLIILDHNYNKNEINKYKGEALSIINPIIDKYNKGNFLFKAQFSKSVGPFFNKSKFINLRFTYSLKVL